MKNSSCAFSAKPVYAPLQGDVVVPGDKSISHRAIMFASLAQGRSVITGLLQGDDVLATLSVFRAMGVKITIGNHEVIVDGVGMSGLVQPNEVLYLGNSGTSARLLTGLFSGLNMTVVFSGDQSLNSRPMSRVIKPLRAMGANMVAMHDKHLPLAILPNGGLQGIDYVSPIASAQLKSSLLLAGMFAKGKTTLVEPAITRDHTERMLAAFGYPVRAHKNASEIEGGHRLQPISLAIPGDLSSAAFLLVAASIVPDSELIIRDVGVNPTRIGVLNILKKMGADITQENNRMFGQEPVADLRVRSSQLQGVVIDETDVSLAIDEFPVLFIAAACAKGQTVLQGAEELRVKESDRIQVMADGLQDVGIQVSVQSDGMIIEGGIIDGGRVKSHHDHRVSMSFAVASLVSRKPIIIEECENVSTSFPGFVALVNGLGFSIEETEHV